MKQVTQCVYFLLLIGLLYLTAAQTDCSCLPNLYPSPRNCNCGTGQGTFTIGKVVFSFFLNGQSSNDPKLAPFTAATQNFTQQIGPVKDTSGDTLTVTVNLQNLDDPIVYQKPSIADETYSVSLKSGTAATFDCVGYPSFYLALTTLKQILVQSILKPLENPLLCTFQGLPLQIINDSPSFEYRGLMVDTARHFQPISVLQDVVKAMAEIKLNVLHLHLTDSDSFPLQLDEYSEITDSGAFSKSQIYSKSDIATFTKFAASYGIIVVPELDQPAHARSWTMNDKYKGLNTCNNYLPQDWDKMCLQPPCGQLDPSQDLTYTIVKSVFEQTMAMFPSYYVHMGGDEVRKGCWDQSQNLQQFMIDNQIAAGDYNALQSYYRKKLDSKIDFSKHEQIFWWAESAANVYLSPSYVVQFWDEEINYKDLQNLPNKVILSPVDKLYLDCGAGNQFGGVSWCEPYKTWKVIYSFDPLAGGVIDRSRIMGGVGTLWSEEVLPDQVNQKLWPRVLSLSLRLWKVEEQLTDLRIVQKMFAYANRLNVLGLEQSGITTEYCEKKPENCFFEETNEKF